MIPPTAKPVLDEPEAETEEGPDAPMTEDQARELRALCEELGEEFDTSLTERQANARIDALKERKEQS
ncbi:DUF3072 domain-containing protein [Histidinibacterium aquaticum]|nr:DUF3072 domain-containing protein [Histidinibacterium aquaticum]